MQKELERLYSKKTLKNAMVSNSLCDVSLHRLDLPPEAFTVFFLMGNDLSNLSAVSVLSQKYNACTFFVFKSKM